MPNSLSAPLIKRTKVLTTDKLGLNLNIKTLLASNFRAIHKEYGV